MAQFQHPVERLGEYLGALGTAGPVLSIEYRERHPCAAQRLRAGAVKGDRLVPVCCANGRTVVADTWGACRGSRRRVVEPDLSREASEHIWVVQVSALGEVGGEEPIQEFLSDTVCSTELEHAVRTTRVDELQIVKAQLDALRGRDVAYVRQSLLHVRDRHALVALQILCHRAMEPFREARGELETPMIDLDGNPGVILPEQFDRPLEPAFADETPWAADIEPDVSCDRGR